MLFDPFRRRMTNFGKLPELEVDSRQQAPATSALQPSALTETRGLSPMEYSPPVLVDLAPRVARMSFERDNQPRFRSARIRMAAAERHPPGTGVYYRYDVETDGKTRSIEVNLQWGREYVVEFAFARDLVYTGRGVILEEIP